MEWGAGAWLRRSRRETRGMEGREEENVRWRVEAGGEKMEEGVGSKQPRMHREG